MTRHCKCSTCREERCENSFYKVKACDLKVKRDACLNNVTIKGNFCTSGKNFRYVNVFAPAPGQGNPLNVVLDAGDLTTEEMQSIASRLGGSETAFILSNNEVGGVWPVRVFLPTRELSGAGHPTLGSAWVIKNVILDGTPNVITVDFINGAGPVTVNFEGVQETPFFTVIPVANPDLPGPSAQQAADIFYGGDISKIDQTFPIREINAGLLPWVVVPIADVETLGEAVPNVPLEVASEKIWFLIAPGATNPTSGASASVRAFASYYGIREDAATGSGGSDAAFYMAKYQFLGSNVVDIFVDQGYFIKPQPKPSLLAYRATSDPAGSDPKFVQVGGTVLESDWSNILGNAGLMKIQKDPCDSQ